MSRSCVNRGIACRTTATPPTTTKSTSASARRRKIPLGTNSGQFTTVSSPDLPQLHPLAVHLLKEIQTLLGRQLELSADQRLVHAGGLPAEGQAEVVPGGLHRVLEGLEGGVGGRGLQAGDGGLGGPHAQGELLLGDPGALAGSADGGGGIGHRGYGV